MTSNPTAAHPVGASRLVPAVASKPFGDAEAGEIVALVDGVVARFGMVANFTEQDGLSTPVMVFMQQGQEGEPAAVSWDRYDRHQIVLSFGKAPYFRFDPASSKPARPQFGAAPSGALVVGQTGIRLNVKHASAYAPGTAQFDIGSGELISNPSRSGDVVIPSWELQIPVEGQPPLVLFRFDAGH